MNTVTWTKKAVKQLKRVYRSDVKRIHSEAGKLSQFPNVRNVKQLTGFQYTYRLRIGNYRVFFEFEESVKVIRIEEVKKRDERTY